MSVETDLATKIAAKSADAALNLASDLVNDKPTRLSRIFFAFAPDAAVNWIVNRRLRLKQIKIQEDIFNHCCQSILDNYAKLSKKSSRPARGAASLVRMGLVEQMQEDLRLLATVKRSLAYLPNAASSDNGDHATDESELSWWSTFEDFAKRPNEKWRIDLLAKALAASAEEPGCIRLKALWEIGMLEADDFGMLAFFCDSAVHIDGKPLIVMDPEEQNEFVLDLVDGIRQANLAHIVADLVDRRLIQKALTQFDTSEPVVLGHKSGSHSMRHTPPGFKKGMESVIQIAAYGPTDYTLDICRLYDAEFNSASDANFECLRRSLEEASVSDERVGRIEFSEG